jgi:hypothetical protein
MPRISITAPVAVPESVGSCLDYITLVDGIANHHLYRNAGTPQRGATDRGLNGADDLGKHGRNGLVPGLDVGRN